MFSGNLGRLFQRIRIAPSGAGVAVTVLVTHVTQSFSRGGAGRALLSLADTTSTIVSLTPADPLMRARAEAAGATILEGTAHLSALEAADVVLVHFWNTPELYEFLRGGLPPVRLAVWVHVAGNSAPQVSRASSSSSSTPFAVSAPGTAQLPVFADSASGDPRRGRPGAGRRCRARNRTRVSPSGTSARSTSPSCIRASPSSARRSTSPTPASSSAGSATLPRRSRRRPTPGSSFAATSRRSARSSPSSTCSAIPSLRATTPPRTSHCRRRCRPGVPPVVLAHGEARRLVEHGVTGLVARDEADYPRAIEYLRANPDERLRLGANARAQVRLRQPADVAQDWRSLLTELLEHPKAPRRPLRPAHRSAGVRRVARRHRARVRREPHCRAPRKTQSRPKHGSPQRRPRS